MVFKILCVLVLRAKIASALEGLNNSRDALLKRFRKMWVFKLDEYASMFVYPQVSVSDCPHMLTICIASE